MSIACPRPLMVSSRGLGLGTKYFVASFSKWGLSIPSPTLSHSYSFPIHIQSQHNCHWQWWALYQWVYLWPWVLVLKDLGSLSFLGVEVIHSSIGLSLSGSLCWEPVTSYQNAWFPPGSNSNFPIHLPAHNKWHFSHSCHWISTGCRSPPIPPTHLCWLCLGDNILFEFMHCPITGHESNTYWDIFLAPWSRPLPSMGLLTDSAFTVAPHWLSIHSLTQI